MLTIQHYWDRLPGPVWFNAQHIYRDQVQKASEGSRFVELGAWKGRSTAFMGVEIANSRKSIEFFTVDTWRGTPGEGAHEDDPDIRSERLYEVFCQNIRPVAEFVTPIKSLSTAAASQFEDGSVDFLYLDAGHSFEAVSGDLSAWWPKLRPYATVAGDDWVFRGPGGRFPVREAVQAFFSSVGNLSVSTVDGFVHPEWTQWIVKL